MIPGEIPDASQFEALFPSLSNSDEAPSPSPSRPTHDINFNGVVPAAIGRPAFEPEPDAAGDQWDQSVIDAALRILQRSASLPGHARAVVSACEMTEELARLLEQDAILGEGGGGEDVGGEVRVVRVGDKYAIPTVVKSTDTVLARFIGSDAAHGVFHVVRKLYLAPVAAVAFVIATVSSELVMMGHLPKTILWFSLCLSLPNLCITVAFMNVKLAQWLIFSFEPWYLMINCVLGMAAFVPVASYDERLLFILMNTACVCLVVFADAYHPGAKKFTIFTIIIGLAVQVLWIVASQMGWYVDLHDQTLHVSYGPFEKNTSIILAASQRLLAICTFFIKNLWIACRRPKQCILLRASLHNDTVGTADMVESFSEWGRRFTSRVAHDA